MGEITKRHKGTFGIMEVFIIIIMVYTYIKIVHFKYT